MNIWTRRKVSKENTELQTNENIISISVRFYLGTFWFSMSWSQQPEKHILFIM